MTVVTPSIPPRAALLELARESVRRQDCGWPVPHVVEVDEAHEGISIMRNRMLGRVETEWVCFFDDDDELLPNFVSAHLRHADESGADVVYGGFTSNVFPHVVPESTELALLRQKNMVSGTALVRTELVRKVGGYPAGDDIPWAFNGQFWHPSEDWGLWLRLAELGATFSSFAEITWRYSVHAGSLQGFTW